MKYLLLIYGDEKALNEREWMECYQESAALAHELKEAGQYRTASPLQPTETATSVRVRDGIPLVTGGPFVEAREQLGGFYLVEVKDVDEAIAIAGRIPGARLGTVEVRPLRELPGLPKEGETP